MPIYRKQTVLSTSKYTAPHGYQIPLDEQDKVRYDGIMKTGTFTFAELQRVTSLGKGEIRECINREIISARARVGPGNHRVYSKWNLVEGVIAAALLRQLRAGWVANLMTKLRLLLMADQIDPESYCTAPDDFNFYDFELQFVPRTTLDDKADLVLGEETAKDAFAIATASAVRQPRDRPSLTSDTGSAPFCTLRVDIKQAVLFVNHMMATKL